MNETGLYFHIPFCTKKCPYCHFYVIPNRDDLKEALQDGLEREWQWRAPLLQGKKIVSIYFGGGTPTLFAPEGISRILSWIQGTLTLSSADLKAPDVAIFDKCIAEGVMDESKISIDERFAADRKPAQREENCEITIEANPEEVERPLLEALRQSGVNRLSLGIQSLDDRSLQVLERIHSAKRAKKAIWDAHAAGFTNISIDLMYDLPWQTEESWQTTLSSIEDLPITHLSLYNLTIEPHTVFFKRKATLAKTIPNAEQSLKMLEMGIATFEKMGLKRYEISAFAKNGLVSKHNSGYWTGRPFLGFGPSAFSYWEGKRFRNQANLQRYRRALVNRESPVDFEEKLPYPADVNELLAVRLRLLDGVDLSQWQIPEITKARLLHLESEGLLRQYQGRWQLTSRGTLFYDTVAQELI